MQTKYAMKAVFAPNVETKEGRSKYTLYPEKLFNTYDEAEEALDGEYGDTLAQAATIDSENEEDLKGYYFLYLGIYEVTV